VTGSQNLYGPDVLRRCGALQQIARALDAAGAIPVKVIFKPVLKSPKRCSPLCQEANQSKTCVGLVTWCHHLLAIQNVDHGLKILQKTDSPLSYQHNRDIPWKPLIMDFMNLNQAAHGGSSEHGFDS